MTQLATLTNPRFQYVTPTGPLIGGKVYTCIAGGSISQLQTTYTDSTGATPNANPVILDSNGTASIWGSGFYKLFLQDANGVSVATLDNWSGQQSINGYVTEFVPQGGVYTYISATQFSVPGNSTSTFQVNRRISAQVTAGTIYGSITASSYASGITTVTVKWDGSYVLDSGLSVVSVGILSLTYQSIPQNGLVMNVTGTATNLSAAQVPLSGVTGGTTALYSFSSIGTGCTLTFTVSGGVINAVTAVAAGGSGYKAGDILTVIQAGSGNNSYIRVLTLSGSAVATVEILYGGSGYSAGTAVATNPGVNTFNTITLAGVLTQNITLIMPYNLPYYWNVVNNTTGSFTTTVKASNSSDTAIGTGVVVTQGTSNSSSVTLYTDGLTDVWPTTPAVLAPSATGVTPAIGVNSTIIPTTSWVNSTAHGTVSVAIANGSNTLTSVQYGYHIIVLTGALTAAATVVFPNQADEWVVFNLTTGGQTITLQSGTGAGGTITISTVNGRYDIVTLAGNDIYFANITPNSYDSTSAGATTQFVQNVNALTMATVPLALPNSIGAATYSFGSLGSGCTLTYTVSGGAINAVSSVAAGGSNYAVGDIITVIGGNYDSYIRVATISGSAVATVQILYGGTGYSGGTAIATQVSVSTPYKWKLTGTLTGNATFIMTNGTYLARSDQWLIGNNTTGAYSVTFFISNGSDATTGTGVIIPQGSNNSTNTLIETDGSTDVWKAAPTANAVTAIRDSFRGLQLACTKTGQAGTGTWTLATNASGKIVNGRLVANPAITNTSAASWAVGDMASVGDSTGVGAVIEILAVSSGVPTSIGIVVAGTGYAGSATAAPTVLPTNNVAWSFIEAVLQNSTGDIIRLGSKGGLINGGTTGANALDTGTIGTGWYSAWVIYNPSTGVTAGLLSLQDGVTTTGTNALPTLPAGYTYYARMGDFYYSSGFVKTVQTGDLAVTPLNTVLSGGTTTTTTAVTLNTFCPLLARQTYGMITVSQSSGSTQVTLVNLFASASSAVYDGTQSFEMYLPSGGSSGIAAISIPMKIPQTIWYANGVTTTNTTVQLSAWRY